MKNLRTWIEIDSSALHSNVEQFFKLYPKGIFLAVVKSNAYGHGLREVAKIVSNFGKEKKREVRLGVDSITEALALRRSGLKNEILVLGYILPGMLAAAEKNNITLTVSNFDSLEALTKLSKKPKIFLKMDSGMHRQGFMPNDLPELIVSLKEAEISPEGIYTHFASASNQEHKDFTQNQLKSFKNFTRELEKAGFKNLIKSSGATGGTLFHPQSRLDMVRIGMGLYGYSPDTVLPKNINPHTITGIGTKSTKFSKSMFGVGVNLKPVLSWKTIVGEIKEIPSGEYIGYNLSCKTKNKTKIAILPIGYWHGYDRRFSNTGSVLINGHRCKILGMVSMDMLIVDTSQVPAKVGDEVTIIGAQQDQFIDAPELAQQIGASHYEVLTRINPLIKRIIV